MHGRSALQPENHHLATARAALLQAKGLVEREWRKTIWVAGVGFLLGLGVEIGIECAKGIAFLLERL